MKRVLVVVGRPADNDKLRDRSRCIASRRVSSAPSASSPITPTSAACPPSVATFSATFAAPPSVARLALGRSTGIGASGDRRLALPLT